MPSPTYQDVAQRPWLLDDADELTRLLYRQCGVVSMRQASEHLSRAALRRRLANDQWRRAHRAVLVVHNGPLTAQQRLWVASLAVGNGEPAVIGGRSALAVLGMRGFATEQVDVLVGSARKERDPPANVRVHRTSHLPDRDVHRPGSPPCTTAARSVVDAASWAVSDRQATTVIAMAFQQRLVGVDEIGDVLARLPRAKRRKLTFQTSVDAAGGAHSLGELDLLALLRRAGLPLPSRQVIRTDAHGRKRYLDAVWEEWGLHVEIDGAHHLAAPQAWVDADRQNQLWIAGEVVLRFPAWLVRQRPNTAAADIRRALLALGWRPT